jgi:hypothetical protein
LIDRFHHDFANYETSFEVADIKQVFDQVKYDELVEPKNYDEAWNHPDKFQREKWREAISQEFRDMNRRKVWKKIDRREIPPGRQGGYADPCLMTRRCEKGIVYIALYVNDCYCVGHEEAIQDTITKIIAKGFDVKVEDDLTDYLSCNILFNKNKTKAWLRQLHLIKNLEKKYGEAVKSLQAYKTPGTPGQGIIRPYKGKTSVLASLGDQTLYRSGIGMLLCLVKHSSPDIANVVRELSKVMDGATPAAIKCLTQDITV